MNTPPTTAPGKLLKPPTTAAANACSMKEETLVDDRNVVGTINSAATRPSRPATTQENR